MEVVDVLVKALKATEEARLPDDLRLVGFGKAVDLLSQDPASTSGRRGSGSRSRRPAEKGGDVLDAIARGLEREKAEVEEIYAEDEGELIVVVGTNKLDRTNARGSQELALLVAGGRQLGGIEEWTGVKKIREACEDFGKHDPANFAATITRMVDSFSFKGKGRSREVKIKRPGIERLKGLVGNLLGSDS